MTQDETRQLGIEFERRVQTILPATELAAKLDTETIYSFLNQYQSKYIHEIYRNLDKLEGDTKMSQRIERILQTMITSKLLTKAEDDSSADIEYENLYNLESGTSTTFITPEDYQLYVRSTSHVTKTYNWVGDGIETNTLPNMFVSLAEANKVIEDSYDKLRILRNPIAILSPYTIVDQPPKRDGESDADYNARLARDYYPILDKPALTIIHDRFTNIKQVVLVYYKEPRDFSILTRVDCQLPVECFDDLVTGAVELFIGYVRGGIRQQEEDGRRQRAAQRLAEKEAEQERKNLNEQ